MGILEQIVEIKRQELVGLRQATYDSVFEPRQVDLRRSADGRLNLITEIKRRSPSAGALSRALTVEQRAQAYERSGADMLSILCDSTFFDGSYEHLTRARKACSLPLLCKEFVLDEAQLDAAVAHGADAVLLIVRCLAGPALAGLIAAARQRKLEALVEVCDQAEAGRAVDAGANWIGVNARDLDTLEVDVTRATQVIEQLPQEVVAIHLSGIKTAADVARQKSTRADAALIGEALMRLDDPCPLLGEMVQAASN
jgi:indole-3-glycerol phosphate synthase